MIRADEAVGFAGAVFADGSGAVAAAVQQGVNGALAVAHHDHRLGANLGSFEAAGFRDFADVRNPDPGLRENTIQLQLEQFLRGVERGVDAIGLYQGGNLFAARCRLRRGIDIFDIDDVVTLHNLSPARRRGSNFCQVPVTHPPHASGSPAC